MRDGAAWSLARSNMRRVVFKYPLTEGTDVTLDQVQRHYLYDVLRMREGDELIGLDPLGNTFIVKLGSKTGGTGTVLTQAGEASREPSIGVKLYLPLLKGDKLDLVVQKSVELGVSEIILYAAKRSIVKWTDNQDKKITRMQKIAREATQQCRRHKVPQIQGVVRLEEAAGEQNGVFAWEEEKGTSLREHLNLISDPRSIAILTGPEGGLSKEEAETLGDLGWTPVSLGERILRAETAAITMLACTMFAYGEMG